MLVTLDFESFYDQDYTLKKMSTSEYIRHPKFEAISCSIKIDDGPTTCYFGKEAIAHALAAIDWKVAELLAHHIHFDGLVLSHHFGHIPRHFRDTLSMSRAVSPKSERNDLGSLGRRVGVEIQKLDMPDFKGKALADIPDAERPAIAEYNNVDVDSCYQIYQILLPTFPAGELELIDVTARMFCDPVLRLNEARVMAELKRGIAEKEALVAASGMELTGLRSREKFAAQLRSLGVEPPTKWAKRTKANPEKRKTYAFAQTDLEFLALKTHGDEAVVKLVLGRLAASSTIGETRARRLLWAGKDGQRVPVYLNYCGAHTTRWSGGDKLNFQNFPRFDPDVPHSAELRRSIKAPPGNVLVVVDSAQIECRTLAWLADETWLLDEFGNHGDPYSAFATTAYGYPVSKKNPATTVERQVGKICVLGLGYSMGAYKLWLQLSWKGIKISLERCEQLVRAYRSKGQSTVAFWDKCASIVHDMAIGVPGEYKSLRWDKDKIILPNGLDLHYTDVISTQEDGEEDGSSSRLVRLMEAPADRPAITKSNPMFASAKRTEAVEARYTQGHRVQYLNQSYTAAHGTSHIYGGLLTENVVQALARVIVGEQMRVISERYRVVMMSHDEVVYTVPKREADKALDFGLEVMRQRPDWAKTIPLDAEGGYDVEYSK